MKPVFHLHSVRAETPPLAACQQSGTSVEVGIMDAIKMIIVFNQWLNLHLLKRDET